MTPRARRVRRPASAGRRRRRALRRRRAQASADAPEGQRESSQGLYLDRQHWRKVTNDWRPVVTRVLRRVHLTTRRPEIDTARVERIDPHRVAEYVHVAIPLRQTFRERLPFAASGPAAVHTQLTVERVVLRIA